MRFTAALALALCLPAFSAAERLRGSSQQETAPAAATVEDDYFNDLARTGIDRSLASIHVESEFSFLSDEEIGAIGEYISRYSVDGNTDIPETCPMDYEGDVDPYHPDSYNFARSLMGEMDMDMEMEHSHMHYRESSCNGMLSMATCVNWSEWVDTNNITLSSEVRLIPLFSIPSLYQASQLTLHFIHLFVKFLGQDPLWGVCHPRCSSRTSLGGRNPRL